MATGPVVAFRVDASVSIGTGHVMRCLTLADELAVRGSTCRFICRALDGNLVATVRERGFDCHVLEMPAEASDDRATSHSGWLTVTRETDANESLAILEPMRPDWIVKDHYALDSSWDGLVRRSGGKLLAIDDLADRPHDCDILLDQNVGRAAEDYAGLVPPGCRCLVGTAFALLRPDFARLRVDSLRRRAEAPPRRFLISVGGIDKDNASSRVLDALAAHTLPADCSILVILGRHAPWKDDVARRAREMPVPTDLTVDATDVAALMTEADIAIGAAGSSALERCCMGLPTLMVSVADNQNRIAACLDAAGAARFVGSPFAQDFAGTLRRALEGMLVDPDALRSQQASAAALVDGQGAQRVADALLGANYTVRRATQADAVKIHEWRYGSGGADWYRSAEVPSLEGHLSWFAEALDDDRRQLLIVGRDGEDMAHVRLDQDRSDAAAAWISICLDPGQRGRGRSAPILQAALDHGRGCGIGTFFAEVHAANLSSQKLFERLGFRQSGQDGSFLLYVLAPGLAPGD